MIKLGDFAELITSLGEQSSELKVILPIFSPGKVGGRAGLPVMALDVGFDHDRGKLFLRLDKDVSILTPKQKAAILTSVNRGASWHAYEQHKAIKAKIAEDTERKHVLLRAARESVQKEFDRAGHLGEGDEVRQSLWTLLEGIDAELAPKRRAPGKAN